MPAFAPAFNLGAEADMTPGFNADFLMLNKTTIEFVARDFDFLEAEELRSRSAVSAHSTATSLRRKAGATPLISALVGTSRCILVKLK